MRRESFDVSNRMARSASAFYIYLNSAYTHSPRARIAMSENFIVTHIANVPLLALYVLAL